MDKLREILSQRTQPGVILFNPWKRIRYINKEAMELIPDLTQRKGPKTPKTIALPPELIEILEKMADQSTAGDPFDEPVLFSSILTSSWGIPLSIRGMVLGPAGNPKGANHFLVLVERIVEKRPINFSGVQTRFKLTGREMEILELICFGFSNKEVSDKLFISPHTVKDHLKHIMDKLGLKTRTQIIAFLT